MKKYLKYIKKLQLAKCIFASSIFLNCSSYALADEDKSYNGFITNISYRDEMVCLISIDNKGSIPSNEKKICDFATRAKGANREVILDFYVNTHWFRADEYHVTAIGFAKTKSHWVRDTKKLSGLKYILQGTVDNLIYKEKHNDKFHNKDFCYIAINGPDVRNNLDYHYTNNMEICRLAEDAFYSKMQVRMIATVDVNQTSANDINSLQVTQCCSRSQRN